MADFEVRFTGQVLDHHRELLSRAPMTYERGHSEVIDGAVLHAGAALHHVRVDDVPDADTALRIVMDSLGVDAGNFTRWEAEPISG